MANAILLEPMVPAAISMAGALLGFDFTAGALPSGATLTRASAAYRTNSSGLMVQEAINVARFDYDPITHAALGILIEPAATNAILQSAALDNASWTKSGATVTGNYGNGPTGTAVADRMLVDTSVSGHYANQQPAGTGDQTLSLFVKPLTARYVYIYSIGRVPNDTVNQPFWVFDLATSVIASGSGPAGYTATIARAANGYWRISVSGTSATSANRELRFAITDSSGSQSYTGNGTDDVLVWGVQMESGKVVTSPIDTTTAAASRAADALVLNWGSLGVPNGTYTLRYTFDDDSTQDISTAISGGTSTVPTNLNRARIKKVQNLAFAGSTLDLGVPANLLNDYAGVVAQVPCTIGATNQAKISLDLGADTTFDTILVFGVELFPTNGNFIINYSTAALVSGSDSSGVAYAGASPMTTGKGVSFWSVSAPITARYVDIVYEAGTGVTGKSVRASRVVIGKKITLQRNFSYGGGPGVKDLGTMDFSRRGVIMRAIGKKLRILSLTFSNIRKDEVQASIRPMFERQGITGPVAIVTDPSVDADRQNRCYFGTFVGDLGVIQRNALAWEAKSNLVSFF